MTSFKEEGVVKKRQVMTHGGKGLKVLKKLMT